MKRIAVVAIAIVCSTRLAAQEDKAVPQDSVRVSIPGCARGYVFTTGPRTADQPGSIDLPEGLHLRMNGSKKVMAGKRGDANAIPPIAIKGTNNGAFIRNRHIYWQSENTDRSPDLIDRRSFNDLLASVDPGPKTPEQSLKLMTVPAAP